MRSVVKGSLASSSEMMMGVWSKRGVSAVEMLPMCSSLRSW